MNDGQASSTEFGGAIQESELLQLWSKLILELTGGHPSLFGPAVDGLADLCRRRAKQIDDGFDLRLIDRDSLNDPSTLSAQIRVFLEDQFRGVRALRSALERLRRL